MNNAVPLLLLLAVLKKQQQTASPVFHTLELDAFLDNARSMLNILERLSGMTQDGGSALLPDMKKVMEIVEKLPI